MSVFWYLLWFLVAVSLLVTVHEFGHYWVARRLGFKVLRFSVGFGTPLLKRTGRDPDRTEYVFAALPLGGYVKLLDEREGPVATAELPRAFTRKPPWQRIRATIGSRSPLDTPMMSAKASADFTPPGVQPVTGAWPATTATEKASQPG